MDLKRPFDKYEEDGEPLVLQPKRTRLPLLLRYGEAANQLASSMEPLLRRVVQEEVQKSLLSHVYITPSSSFYQIEDVARFQLHFQNKLPRTLFTDRRITGDDGKCVQIVIKDANLNDIRSGPLSSLMIKIVVVCAEFGGDGKIWWNRHKFHNSILSQRNGRRPLLAGELCIRMRNGVGFINATFTDNSSWTRLGKFRLGAFVSDSKCTGGRVQEAVTEAFKVKDARVESNQKDDPPLLKAEVCCLKKIRKGGASHKKLMAGGINTVQEFLRSYVLYPNKLHSLLGTGKVWEETLKHALQCELGNEHYFYCTSGLEVALVFNSIFQLVGANIDGLYYSLVELSASQKDSLNLYKKLAYENPSDIVKFWDSLDGSLPRFLPAMNVTSSSGSTLSEPHNYALPDIFCGMPSSQTRFQHQPYAACNELPSDTSLQGGQALQRSASIHKPGNSKVYNDDRDTLSVPRSGSSQITHLQATSHDGAVTQMNSEVISGRQGFLLVQRAPSFGTKSSSPDNIFGELLNYQQDEEWMSFIQTIVNETDAPLSPCKWGQLVAVVKWLSNIKRSVARRARIAHPNGIKG